MGKEHLADRLNLDDPGLALGRAETERRAVVPVGVLQVDLVEMGQRGLEHFEVIVLRVQVAVQIAVGDVRAVADPRGAVGVLVVIRGELSGHLTDFVGQRGRLGQTRHRLDREPLHPALVCVVHQLLHVLHIAPDCPRLAPHPVPVDCPGIGAHRLCPDERADVDQALEAAPRHGFPARLVDEEPTQLAVGREDAVDGHALVLGLAPEAEEVLIGQLVDFKKGAQLDVADPLPGQQPKQPLVGEAVLGRVGLDPQL